MQQDLMQISKKLGFVFLHLLWIIPTLLCCSVISNNILQFIKKKLNYSIFGLQVYNIKKKKKKCIIYNDNIYLILNKIIIFSFFWIKHFLYYLKVSYIKSWVLRILFGSVFMQLCDIGLFASLFRRHNEKKIDLKYW